VTETVKRVSGVDSKVEFAPRRDGDPARIVAGSERIRAALGWQPRFDDLSTVVAHALDWERELMTRRSISQLQAAAGRTEAVKPARVADRRA
jgi:UDP-glucose 4-epimerase